MFKLKIFLPSKLSTLYSQRSTLLLIALTLLFLFSSTISYYAFSSRDDSMLTPQSPDSASASSNSATKPDGPTLDAAPINDSIINIALVGHGDQGHLGGHLTDSIILAHFDTDQKLLALISIPRDLWFTLPSGKQDKINAAYAQNPQILLDALTSVTGQKPSHYIGVNFFGIQAIVDEMNGIDINLPSPVQDNYYPIRGAELDTCGFSPEKMEQLHKQYSGYQLERQFKCRYEQIGYRAGNHHIDGAEALKLSRSRHGSSDFDRSLRQQAILIGLKDALLSLDALTNAPAIYKQLEHTFNSNIDIKTATDIASALIDLPNYQITQIGLSTDNVLTTGTGPQGQFILTPKDGSYQSLANYVTSQLTP